MDQYKISDLTIRNFKCFDDIIFNFHSNNLIVFDGPNGYGKTTAFEALEILLTKVPRKLTKIKLDKRYSYKNSPIHKVENLPIEISANFYLDGKQSLNVKRIIPPASTTNSKRNNIGQIFNDSALYINDSPSGEEDLEEVMQFLNIHNLFNVLNYIEQDENTYFLKEDPKERYRALVSLLGGNEERVAYEKTIDFCRKISEKLDQINTEISLINSRSIEAIDNNFIPDYKQLLHSPASTIPWDNTIINNIDLDIHNSYITEVNKIENLYNYRSYIDDVLTLQRQNSFLKDSSFISLLTEKFWSTQNLAFLIAENDKRKANLIDISEYSLINRLISENRYSELIENKYLFALEFRDNKPDIDFSLFRAKLDLIILLKDSLSIQNSILYDLKHKRENLNTLIEEHQSLINLSGGQCPTCGYNWESSEQLREKIIITEEKIFSNYNSENQKLEVLKSELKDTFLNTLKSFVITQEQQLLSENTNLINEREFELIKDSHSRLSSSFNRFFDLLPQNVRETILPLINLRQLENKEDTIRKLLEILEEAKPKLDISIDIEELTTSFNMYFSGNKEHIEVLKPEDFTQKKLYIQHQFYNSINQSLQLLVQRGEKLKKLYMDINRISQKIDASIRLYTKSIVEKISIPFYIFTGKILQNHSLGSGLLLILDINKESSQIYIRPKHRDQEVTYTLSSGQLAATVISLMLVLNKVFNNSKLGTIFIDDPLQTLDEINSHSLVELLKYNFSNQQIILSTHEDRYSKLIKYKFNKFNLSNMSLNLKDIV